ncbi:MAG: hypothetical protein M1813_001467 [Trichoglossum hirsutum]|nr:MAG: hypothetical protein M1813_001467 [Trichoglossum hirsutum]
MSRGGRGGWRGGRLGGPGKIAGADVPWAWDPDLKLDYTPSQLYPPVQPPVPTPLTRPERLQVSLYRHLRDRIHEGPLYTVLGDSHRIGHKGASGAGQINPFEGVPTYSMRYMKKKRKLPRLDTRPYGEATNLAPNFLLKFFPKELWSTLDPDSTAPGGARSSKKKKLIVSTTHANGLSEDEWGSPDPEQGGDGGLSSKAALERRKGMLNSLLNDEEDEEDTKDGMRNADDEQPEEEEEVDDDFEDEEEEMAGDYNAEGYFEDGGDDYPDDLDDGGGADGEGWY